MITPKMDQYYEKIRDKKRQDYRRLNHQTLVYPELIFIGDSITEWFPIERLMNIKRAWVNRGSAASNSQHLLDHLAVHVFGSAVRQVVLLIGTNDIGYDLPREKTLANVREMIGQIRADYPLATVYLLEVLPVNEDKVYHHTVDNRTNQAIQDLNKGYAALADDLAGVELVNTYHSFLNEAGQLAPDLTKDGLHLSEAGYVLLAEILQQVI